MACPLVARGARVRLETMRAREPVPKDLDAGWISEDDRPTLRCVYVGLPAGATP